MKAFSTVTYGALGLAALFAHHQFVTVTQGLYAQIIHEGKVLSEISAIDQVEHYTVKLDLSCNSESMWSNLLNWYFKDALDHCSQYVAYLRHIAAEFSCGKKPSLQKESVDVLSIPLLNLKSSGSNDERDMVQLIPGTIEGKPYTTGWIMKGKLLDKWIQNKWIFYCDNRWFISDQTYISENKGTYLIKWTEPGLYHIYLGNHDAKLGWPHLPKGDLTATVLFFGDSIKGQQIRINVDVHAISIPNSYYESMKKKLPENNSWKIDGYGQFTEPCTDISFPKSMLRSGQTSLAFKIKFSNNETIELSAMHYIYKEKDMCSLLIDKSDDETWVLGTAIVNAKSILIENTGEDLIYRFAESYNALRVASP